MKKKIFPCNISILAYNRSLSPFLRMISDLPATTLWVITFFILSFLSINNFFCSHFFFITSYYFANIFGNYCFITLITGIEHNSAIQKFNWDWRNKEINEIIKKKKSFNGTKCSTPMVLYIKYKKRRENNVHVEKWKSAIYKMANKVYITCDSLKSSGIYTLYLYIYMYIVWQKFLITVITFSSSFHWEELLNCF